MRGNSHVRCEPGEKSETLETVDLPIGIYIIAVPTISIIVGKGVWAKVNFFDTIRVDAHTVEHLPNILDIHILLDIHCTN